jgi:hypothetical protein
VRGRRVVSNERSLGLKPRDVSIDDREVVSIEEVDSGRPE